MAGLFGAALRRPRPTALEEAEWVLAARAGDGAARNRLVEANLWAVIFITRRFPRQGVERADLVQEGVLGLIGAIPYFDVDRGARLASFAMPRVWNAIARAFLHDWRAIRLSTDWGAPVNRVRRAVRHLEAALDRPATVNEVADEAGADAQGAAHLLMVSRAPLSLDDAPPFEEASEDETADDRRICLGDAVIDAGGIDPCQMAVERVTEGEVSDLLWRVLPPEVAYLVERRAGLDGRGGAAFVELAREMGVTPGQAWRMLQSVSSRLRPTLMAWLGVVDRAGNLG